MSNTVNWDDLIKSASSGFEALPNGDYNVTVEKAEVVTASTGAPMIKTVFVVEDGPHAGRKIFNNFVLTVDNPDALGFFFQNMGHLGLDRTFFASLQGSMQDSLPQVAASLPTRRCRLSLGQREWNGQMRNNVLRVMPAMTGMGAPTLGNAAAPSVPLGGAPQPVAQPVAQPAPAPQTAPVPPAAPGGLVPSEPAPAPVAQPVAAPQPAFQQGGIVPQPGPAPQYAPAPVATPAPAPQPAPAPPPQDAQAAAVQALAAAQAVQAQQAAAQPQPEPEPEVQPAPTAAPPAPPF